MESLLPGCETGMTLLVFPFTALQWPFKISLRQDVIVHRWTIFKIGLSGLILGVWKAKLCQNLKCSNCKDSFWIVFHILRYLRWSRCTKMTPIKSWIPDFRAANITVSGKCTFRKPFASWQIRFLLSQGNFAIWHKFTFLLCWGLLAKGTSKLY